MAVMFYRAFAREESSLSKNIYCSRLFFPCKIISILTVYVIELSRSLPRDDWDTYMYM